MKKRFFDCLDLGSPAGSCSTPGTKFRSAKILHERSFEPARIVPNWYSWPKKFLPVRRDRSVDLPDECSYRKGSRWPSSGALGKRDRDPFAWFLAFEIDARAGFTSPREQDYSSFSNASLLVSQAVPNASSDVVSKVNTIPTAPSRGTLKALMLRNLKTKIMRMDARITHPQTV